MRLFKKKNEKRMKMLPDDGFPALVGPGYREVLVGLERHTNAQWYLEIGSRSGTSLSDRLCNFVAIDPEFSLSGNVFNGSVSQLFFQEESDAFFDRGFLRAAGIVPDFAFIDGMHLIEYVLRDFRNLEAAMSVDGVVAFHDVLPFNTQMTTRASNALDVLDAWTGDVWKIIPILQKWRPDLVIEVVGAMKTGLLVVRNLDPKNRTFFDKEDEILGEFRDVDLADFGAKKFFGSFTVVEPAAYISSLKTT